MKNLNLLFFAILLMLGTSLQAAHLSESLLVTARLSGSQEVPAVATNATGVASFRLNASKDTMCIDVITIGLSGPITGIHVHDGVAGTNGGVVLNLTSFVNGNRVSAIITGSDLSSDKLAKYLSGGYYLNVHTTANPSGEIRGQLKLETDKGFKAELDAAQQTHTVTSTATGLGAFSVSLAQEKLGVKLIATNLSGSITAAHLHYGEVGVAGGVAVDLSSMINGNTIEGTVDITAVAGLMDSLMAGKVYVNIHTAANPSGEIRGQLTTNNNLFFDGMMDTGQEAHAVVNSSAKGVVIVEVSPSLDSVFTQCLIDSLSGAITAAHLHTGAAGVNGGVVIDVTSGIIGGISVKATYALNIVTELGILNSLLTGGIYLNAHTAANPMGEARGQLSRLAREGYVVTLDGAQEVPAVTTSAQGIGIVSIDRGRSNAHYMVVVSGLSGNITGAHFHNAAAGANGGVVYDLSGSFTMMGTEDGAFGYWTDLDANAAFTTANEVMFRNDEIYVNIHTMANASGEIRGQVLRGANCNNMTTSTNRQEIFEKVALFPNPTSGQMTLAVSSTIDFDGQLMISNTLGQVVKQEIIPQGTNLSNYQINVSDLSNGLYFLTIKNDTHDYTIRFVKN